MAVRHALFAQRGAERLREEDEVMGMSGDGLSLNDQAKLVRAKLDAQANADAIRASLFPPDEEVA